MVGVQLVTETSILSYFIAVIPSSADPSYRYANLSTLLTDLIFAFVTMHLSSYIFQGPRSGFSSVGGGGGANANALA